MLINLRGAYIAIDGKDIPTMENARTPYNDAELMPNLRIGIVPSMNTPID